MDSEHLQVILSKFYILKSLRFNFYFSLALKILSNAYIFLLLLEFLPHKKDIFSLLL
nr:MAG TPA: hypothetical protein [Caudoviricetes sp.]